MQAELNDDDKEQEAKIVEKKNDKKTSFISTAKCPQCGGNLVFEGGCNICKDCGWSKCD